MRPIYYNSALIARSDDRPLPRDLTISPKPIRNKRLALYVIASLLIIVFAFTFISQLLIPKKLQITFADDKTLEGDGAGPYTSGSDGVNFQSVYSQLPDQNIFAFQSYESPTRSIYIRFDEAEWKDRNLADIPPELPSMNYRVVIACGHRSILINTMEIGQVLEPYVWLTLYEADTGEMLDNFLIRDLVPFDNVTLPQEPPSRLYEQGHAVLTRQSEDVWVLDIDAWFTEVTHTTGVLLPNSPKCYVRISFVMTINLRA